MTGGEEMKLFALILTLWSAHAFALTEASLPQTFTTVAIPYFESSPSQVMTAVDGIQIHYRIYRSTNTNRGALVLVTGRGESMRKYAEFLYDLRQSGFTVFTYDQRGQGESQRLINDPIKGYVAHYQDYVDDLNQFINEVVRPAAEANAAAPAAKIYLLGHSMGGGIVPAYLIQHPGIATAAVLSSPMIEPNIGMPQELGLTILDGAVTLGFGEDYAPTKGPNDWKTPFEKNSLTHSQARYDDTLGQLVAHPELVIAGPTNRWVREAILLGQYLNAHAGDVSTPTLMLTSGQEKLVVPDAEHSYAATAKNVSTLNFPGAYHETLMERDEIRSAAIEAALQFLYKY